MERQLADKRLKLVTPLCFYPYASEHCSLHWLKTVLVQRPAAVLQSQPAVRACSAICSPNVNPFLSDQGIPMQQFPLAYASGHFFATIGGECWVIDTGSPASFGRATTLQLDGVRHNVSGEYFGLSGKTLATLVGEELSGLIGNDILNSVDVRMDPSGDSLVLSAQPIEMEGTGIELDEFMGVPILEAISASQTHRMFFDTGAQVSYSQHDSFDTYDAAGQLQTSFQVWGSSPRAPAWYRSK